MKNRIKTILTLSLMLVTIFANAQIKVHGDGHLSIGTLSDNWEVGTHIYRTGWAVFNTSLTTPWHIVTLATPGVESAKCWIVTAPNNKTCYRFYVTGEGYVYKLRSYTNSDGSTQSNTEQIENAGATIDNITGIWYDLVNDTCLRTSKDSDLRCAGVCAQEVEKVLPEAVTADEHGTLFVNYETLTVFLIEAVKEQRHEIQQMQQILKDNGLLKQ